MVIGSGESRHRVWFPNPDCPLTREPFVFASQVLGMLHSSIVLYMCVRWV